MRDAGPNFVVQRLKVRRRQATTAFVAALSLGFLIIAGSIFLPDVADRVDKISAFLIMFFSGLFSIVAWYWGLGTYESKSFLSEAYDAYSRDPVERYRERRKRNRYGLDDEEELS